MRALFLRGTHSALPDDLLLNYRYDVGSSTLATITSETSGCCYNDLTGTLFVIASDGSRKIFELETSGMTVVRSITFSGYSDPEALCWMGGTTYAMTDEASQTGAITIITIDTGTTSVVKPTSGANFITTNASDYSAAYGWEGLAYDAANDVFYGLLEKATGAGSAGCRVYSINRSTGNCTQLTTLSTALSAIMTDASDLHWSPLRGTLFVLSHESKRIAECNVTTQAIVSSRAIPNMTQAEGLTFNSAMTTAWILGEANKWCRMVYTGGSIVLPADTFNDNSLDSVLWTFGSAIGSQDAAVTVAEQNQRLEIQPDGSASPAKYNGIVGNAAFDSRGLSLIFRLNFSATPPVVATFIVRVGWYIDSSNYVCITTDNNGTNARLSGRVMTAGSGTNGTNATYNATNHAWLRLRVSADGTTAYYDSAPDSAGVPGTWTNTFSSQSVSIDMSSVKLFALAGQSNTVSGPPAVYVDQIYTEVT